MVGLRSVRGRNAVGIASKRLTVCLEVEGNCLLERQFLESWYSWSIDMVFV